MSSATGASGTGSPRSASAEGRGSPPSSRRPERRMILTRYYLGCLAHASYLIGDEASRTAAVVDPQRDVDQYLADANRLGLTVGHEVRVEVGAEHVADRQSQTGRGPVPARRAPPGVAGPPGLPPP